jgi:tetratricopeptide (TPR) repeat protein
MLVLGIAASLWQARRANREARRALQAEAVAKERLAESQAVSKFMTGVFQSPDPARNGRTITVVETLDRAVTNLDHDLAAQPGVRAQLQTTLGGTFESLGLYDEAISLKEKALDYNLKTFGSEHTNTLGAMQNLMVSYFHAGRYDETLKVCEELLAVRRKLNGPEHPDTLKAMGSLANCYSVTGRQDEALKLREEVLRLRRKVLGPEHPDTLIAMGRLEMSYSAAGRKDDALKLNEEVLALDRKVLGPEHPNTLVAIGGLANCYFVAGRRDEALKLREEVLTLDRKVLAPGHPNTLGAMENLAVSYADAGRKDEALKLQEEALALSRKVNGPKYPDTLEAMNSLASTLATSDKATIRNGTNAVQLAEAAVAATSRKNPDYLDTLAAAYAEMQQFDKASAAEREAIGLLKTEAEKKDCASRLSLYQANKPYHEQKKP